jgi:hypothetical protein
MRSALRICATTGLMHCSKHSIDLLVGGLSPHGAGVRLNRTAAIAAVPNLLTLALAAGCDRRTQYLHPQIIRMQLAQRRDGSRLD